jgi:ssDNA-binding Zn-finger/Zn-ribbon topoisomerase 1
MTIRLVQVECLNCGHRRAVLAIEQRTGEDECPRCRYVGWAASAELTERTRQMLRERPIERRRLRAV